MCVLSKENSVWGAWGCTGVRVGGGGAGGAHTYVLTASGIWSLKRGKVRCVYTITIITVSVSVQLGGGGGVSSVCTSLLMKFDDFFVFVLGKNMWVMGDKSVSTVVCVCVFFFLGGGGGGVFASHDKSSKAM